MFSHVLKYESTTIDEIATSFFLKFWVENLHLTFSRHSSNPVL